MVYYKGFNSDMTCRGLGADAAGDGDKRVSRHITIGAKTNIAGMTKAHLKLVWEKVDKEPHPAATSVPGSTAATSGHWSTAATSGDESTAATSGDESTAATSGHGSTAATSGDESTAATSGGWSTAATSGHWSTAAASGDGSTAAASGDYSTAAASGDGSTAATSGDYSTAAVDGKHSIAVAGGFACKARGALGCWLVLAERNDRGEILDVQAVRVDGGIIKPDTLYTLTGGRVTEVGADE